ncbi:cytochrome c-type biogenesis protein [Variovorax rhizosphaerae]|uniref:Cytochrome c-type biogenesis protein n=1 Tax=Variovorax rhizosphaerae TaxID=1836200 RepID=A0ABU8WU10_9BURK
MGSNPLNKSSAQRGRAPSRGSARRLPRSWLAALALAIASLPAGTAVAGEAQPLAADPAMEARVNDIASELRCLVCQNETLAASQSSLAEDLRKQIEHQLAQGRSPRQIRAYMVERYGEFVLYRPAFNATTALLWIGPFAMLGAAFAYLLRTLRRRNVDGGPAELDAVERKRVQQLLEGGVGES